MLAVLPMAIQTVEARPPPPFWVTQFIIDTPRLQESWQGTYNPITYLASSETQPQSYRIWHHHAKNTQIPNTPMVTGVRAKICYARADLPNVGLDILVFRTTSYEGTIEDVKAGRVDVTTVYGWKYKYINLGTSWKGKYIECRWAEWEPQLWRIYVRIELQILIGST